MGNKLKKIKKRLKARQNHYEEMVANSPTGGKEFTRPGRLR